MQSPIAKVALMKIANGLSRSEQGQDLLEYGMLVALIALVAIGAVSVLGQTIYQFFWDNIANNF